MADSLKRQGKYTKNSATHSDRSATDSSPLEVVDVPFPLSETDISKLYDYCDKIKLPFAFGKNVSLKKYNDWLGHRERGLRFSYDMHHKYVIFREDYTWLHYTVRKAFRKSLQRAFAGIYTSKYGRVMTPATFQDFTPDGAMCHVVGANRHFPVLAEVGVAQTEKELNSRSADLLAAVPGAAVVVLIKIHIDESVENGRMYAWCVTQDASDTLVYHPQVEFGFVRAGGAARPTITVPAHDEVAATPVSLVGILVDLCTGRNLTWTKKTMDDQPTAKKQRVSQLNREPKQKVITAEKEAWNAEKKVWEAEKKLHEAKEKEFRSELEAEHRTYDAKENVWKAKEYAWEAEKKSYEAKEEGHRSELVADAWKAKEDEWEVEKKLHEAKEKEFRSELEAEHMFYDAKENVWKAKEVSWEAQKKLWEAENNFVKDAWVAEKKTWKAREDALEAEREKALDAVLNDWKADKKRRKIEKKALKKENAELKAKLAANQK